MPTFRFSIPPLPKVWYDKLRELCKGLGLTQRQVIILGLKAIIVLGQQNEETVKALAAQIKTEHPQT